MDNKNEYESKGVFKQVALSYQNHAASNGLQRLVRASRLPAGAAAPALHSESAERLLTGKEVAHAQGMTKRWVQRRARRLPFARQLSDHAIRYSEAGLRRWMANRHVHAA
ncbi:MAG: hypothetical protein A3G21_21800 [Acidobacteria bacterium RIFCSPLOWO2_12_FULL_66_21]|nr:MAG: hypothetical protein A3G21_21800 [Acidobacteria bacterium RIFCSPLOWO2_12_FULL_66_21]